jgi:hypothetical protein
MRAVPKLGEAVPRDSRDLIKLIAEQIEYRDVRIKQLEKLNSQLAQRIDQLEAENKKGLNDKCCQGAVRMT